MTLVNKSTNQIIEESLARYDKELESLKAEKMAIERDLRDHLRSEALKRIKKDILG